ncbi:MAG: adenosylcobalamin-dependent ribonucleoside-diphosphate reductase, partial [Duncaniella sp.]|nr:adenosylcobalamin-dependent ribonucleoside-diphosphate reductase [Duncaniella sp.]
KHPDSERFIDAKLEQGKITGANVSVKIDDGFMRAVESGENYVRQFPIDAAEPAVSVDTDAKALWDKIVYNAWKSAEPGVLFWDTIIRESLPDCYADLGFQTVSTNPCGEIPLCPYASCRLVAVNLYSYVKNPFTPEAYFDFDLFAGHIRKAQRIMDDIIDLEMEKIDTIIAKIEADPELAEVKQTELNLWLKIRAKTLKGRRTGLGTTAEGDMIAALGLRYGTAEATEMSIRVHRALALAAFGSSVEMARERGAFEVYDAAREKDNPMICRMRLEAPALVEEMERHGRRNIACLTIAPTGTTSLMTRTSSGIEPVFMPVYKRRRKINANDVEARVDYVDESGDKFEEFVVYHPKFLEWMKTVGIEPRTDYTQAEIDALVQRSPYYKATAADIDWVEKVRMQGAVQKWVDHSISVTINLPSDVSVETVNRLYLEAWKAGCKGCTIYRDGSRSGVLIATEEEKKRKEKRREEEEAEKNAAKDAPSASPAEKPNTLVRPFELDA